NRGSRPLRLQKRQAPHGDRVPSPLAKDERTARSPARPGRPRGACLVSPASARALRESDLDPLSGLARASCIQATRALRAPSRWLVFGELAQAGRQAARLRDTRARAERAARRAARQARPA